MISHVRGQVPLSHAGTIIGLYVGNGDLGVQTFFVLSGYLMTTLLIEEFENRGTIDVRRLYLRRVGRIFPPFYVWLAVLRVLAALGYVRVRVPDFIGTALFVGNTSPVCSRSRGDRQQLDAEHRAIVLRRLSGIRTPRGIS